MYNLNAGVEKKNVYYFILEEQLCYVTKLKILYISNAYPYLHYFSKYKEATYKYCF